ncbi:hypothetical protein AGMMS49574_00460 [Bacteroidia bacterium]|nr:hypothetical protein AGMMS49574_00460 [Bacteroidia bacterium]GHU58683.1 hypothetical protein FACS189411_14500 [Bacteroidia bacterium]
MKAIILLITILLSTYSRSEDCQSFYKRTLYEVEFKGIVKSKQENSNYYILKIQTNDKNEIKQVLFLKNDSGKEIYEFTKVGSLISKITSVTYITILTSMDLGNVEGKQIELCQ